MPGIFGDVSLLGQMKTSPPYMHPSSHTYTFLIHLYIHTWLYLSIFIIYVYLDCRKMKSFVNMRRTARRRRSEYLYVNFHTNNSLPYRKKNYTLYLYGRAKKCSFKENFHLQFAQIVFANLRGSVSSLQNGRLLVNLLTVGPCYNLC